MKQNSGVHYHGENAKSPEIFIAYLLSIGAQYLCRNICSLSNLLIQIHIEGFLGEIISLLLIMLLT